LKLAILAAVSMAFQDVLGTLMVQFEGNSLKLPVRHRARDYVLGGWRAWGAALFDEAQWIAWGLSTTVTVSAFAGHNDRLKVEVFLLVSAANIVGTRTGQETGIWLLRRRGKDMPLTVEDRVAALEASVFEHG
jgi:hypothetical protein